MSPLPGDPRGSDPRVRVAQEVSSEEFLFHLYRGTELLQDDRVHDAKEELEAALRLQPLDPKGQDLLAVVYFRLGLYPRAMEIFEQLVLAYPTQRTPRVNLSLCYLKTGQPQAARQLLEDTVAIFPDNARAWGYLGLSYERLGDYTRARDAFVRGGHDGMARRMEELLEPDEDAPPSVARSIAEAFEELGVPSLPPLPRRATPPQPAAHPTSARPPRPPSVRPPRPPSIAPVSLGAARPPSVAPPPPARLPADSVPDPPERASADSFARGLARPFPPATDARIEDGGLLRVATPAGLACRMDRVRALACGAGASLAPSVLQRRSRGRDQDEPLGGSLSPIVKLEGTSGVALGARPGGRLHCLVLDDDGLYVREEALLAFEPSIGWENGRLALGDGDAAALVQLRGRGLVVFESPGPLGGIEVIPGGTALARRENVIGWVGRLVPRALSLSEAPAGQRGLLAFSGEGTLIFDAR